MATGHGTNGQTLRDAAAGPQLPATEGRVTEKQTTSGRTIAVERRQTRSTR
jgi:hypothetical protein